MIVAVDTGGTKTLVATFDTTGTVVAKNKFPTPTDFSDYLAQLKITIDELLAGTEPTCISVALPGTIDQGVMTWGGNLSWKGVDMNARLAGHYDCPIVIENDANLAGLAEARALPDIPPVCLYVTVSTGIGTGVIRDGKIDPSFAQSEGGWMILEHDGALRGWETFASGKAIQRTYGKIAADISSKRVWHVITRNIAVGLLALCPVIRPNVIVIGGGVGTHFDKFGDELRGLLKEQLHPTYVPQLIKQADHPEEAVIYGCYYNALDQLAA
jgi:predicted NBD/HSP70 family sugar kinase